MATSLVRLARLCVRRGAIDVAIGVLLGASVVDHDPGSVAELADLALRWPPAAGVVAARLSQLGGEGEGGGMGEQAKELAVLVGSIATIRSEGLGSRRGRGRPLGVTWPIRLGAGGTVRLTVGGGGG